MAPHMLQDFVFLMLKKVSRDQCYQLFSASVVSPILSFTATWMNLEGIVLSEVCQTEMGK